MGLTLLAPGGCMLGPVGGSIIQKACGDWGGGGVMSGQSKKSLASLQPCSLLSIIKAIVMVENSTHKFELKS